MYRDFTYSDKMGRRRRLPICIIMTEDGSFHRFEGEDIPKVAKVKAARYAKQGRGSHHTYTVVVRETTLSCDFRQDWEDGVFFPEGTWEEAIEKMASRLGSDEKPADINPDKFKEFIKEEFPGAYDHWEATSPDGLDAFFG